VNRGGPQAVSEEKSLQNLSDTEQMKNATIHVRAKTALVG
jgi:hypothetical protein